MKKVVLAYSGGLDTSCIIPWLKERGYETIAFVANVGQGDNFQKIEAKALKSGAAKVYCLDLRQELIEDYAMPALKAGALYQGTYVLACALSRPLIARHQVLIAKQEGAQGLVHGCTGKGNDQVRFETTFRLMAPELEIIAPVRTWEFKTREEEIEYARRMNIPVPVTKKSPYSIDTNVYGKAIECGVLEDPWREPPEEVFTMSKNPLSAPDQPQYITVDFEQGIPVKLNGKALAPLALVERLNAVAGKHGVGRVDMIENRLVGIKSREVYENPGATVLHTAIRDLESLVLDRETMQYKARVSHKYAELTYNGLWWTPLKAQLDAMMETVHTRTTGTVRIKLYKGICMAVGRRSPFSRYKEKMATYSAGDTFDQTKAEGFNALWAMPFQD